MNTRSILSIVALSTVAAACDLEQPASRAEMREAVVEVAKLGEGTGAETEIIEITTSFTLGQGAQAIAEEVAAFVGSQVACSTVTVMQGSVAIDFGELGDACTYRGRTYAGVVTVTFEEHGDGVRVTHTYEGLTGGTTTLDGTAVVDWDGNVRHIVTELDFVTDDATLHVEGDRTQTFSACEGVDAVCVDVEGERSWTAPRGTWQQDIVDVRMRSIDPVPEAGTYATTNPEGKTIDLSFSRVDDDTIEVTVSGGRRDFVFHVTAAGQVEDA